MRRTLALVVVGIALVFFVGRSQFVIEGKSLGTAALGGVSSALTLSNSTSGDVMAALQKENASLRVQVFDQSLSTTTPNTFKVYSDYPLNSKQEISIAGGSNQGVKQGDIVTWGNNVLIGKVITVLGDSSIVSTIFDPSWQMAVRIGNTQIDGLFQGGNSPMVTLIPQDGQVNIGDIVVTAATGFPYGLEVGVVKDISTTSNSVFRESTLQTEVNIPDLRDVTVHN